MQENAGVYIDVGGTNIMIKHRELHMIRIVKPPQGLLRIYR